MPSATCISKDIQLAIATVRPRSLDMGLAVHQLLQESCIW